MEILWQELSFGMPGSKELTQVLLRLLAAILAGAAVGYERERWEPVCLFWRERATECLRRDYLVSYRVL